jgi:hypothetical protein
MVIDAVTVLNVAVIPETCTSKLAGSSNQKAFAAWRNHLSGHALPCAVSAAILRTLPLFMSMLVMSKVMEQTSGE